MDTLYAEEKFLQAERALAVGQGDIKGRLNAAYMCFHPVGAEDLPEELRDDYKWIISKLTRKPALTAKYSENNISGSVEQTLHSMQRKTAVSIAERILYMRRQLSEYNGQGSDGQS